MKDYQQQAMRTAAPLGSDQADFVHGALGLVDEAYELMHATDNQNTLEELGDALWFTALCGTALHRDPFEVVVPSIKFMPITAMEMISEKAAIIAGMAKKWHAYGKAPDTDEAMGRLQEIVTLAVNIGYHFGWTLAEVQEANIRKLRARFPGKFTQEQALNRDKQAEYAAMGGE